MKQDSAHSDQLDLLLGRLRSWFCEAALPLWAAHGYDEKRGGFYEALNFDATPSVNRPRRVRTQARQIHTLSQAGIRGWHQSAEAIAARGFENMLNHACPDDGVRGCVHHLGDDGSVLDDRRDLYDQAFLLLACASRWQAAKDDRALSLAQNTITFLDRELSSPHGGWLESDKKELPRRQNPHMHLFEAFMALFRATHEERYLDYARHILSPCFEAFFNKASGVLFERFTEDLQHRVAQHRIEPGHMFEWVWLLNSYEALAREDLKTVRSSLYSQGAHFGVDINFYGFVNNEADINEPAKRAAKRLWPQTEYLRASLVQAASGDIQARDCAASIVNGMFLSYLRVEPLGLWIDEFDGHGAPIAKDVPASILYHLLEAVIEAENFKSARNAA